MSTTTRAAFWLSGPRVPLTRVGSVRGFGLNSATFGLLSVLHEVLSPAKQLCGIVIERPQTNVASTTHKLTDFCRLRVHVPRTARSRSQRTTPLKRCGSFGCLAGRDCGLRGRRRCGRRGGSSAVHTACHPVERDGRNRASRGECKHGVEPERLPQRADFAGGGTVAELRERWAPVWIRVGCHRIN